MLVVRGVALSAFFRCLGAIRPPILEETDGRFEGFIDSSLLEDDDDDVLLLELVTLVKKMFFFTIGALIIVRCKVDFLDAADSVVAVAPKKDAIVRWIL